MSDIISEQSAESLVVKEERPSIWRRLLKNPSVVIGGFLIAVIAIVGPLAPLLTSLDPTEINPRSRNKPLATKHSFAMMTATKYRSSHIWARTASVATCIRAWCTGRVSLTVGVTVALISVSAGLFIGLIAGYFRWIDAVVMRVMEWLDGNTRHLACHRSGITVRRKSAHCNRRNRDSGNPTSGALGAFYRAVNQRRTVRRGRRYPWAHLRTRFFGGTSYPTRSRR